MGKETSETLLSICIPTYNRADALGRLLSTIYSQMRGLEGKVEVCISDNCSTDGTRRVIQSWKKRVPITKTRNSSNLGYDLNALSALQLAKGKFAWFLGDDDILLDGSLKTFIRDIEANPGFHGPVYLNAKRDDNRGIDFNFGAFRFFGIKGKSAPQFDVSVMASVCLHRLTAKKIVAEKIRVKNKCAYKAGDDPLLLHDFIHTYLFLETALKAGGFGIEPVPCAHLLKETAPSSYQRDMYRSLILLTYALELHKHYGWANDRMPFFFSIKSHFARAAMAARNPGLEEAYLLAKELFLRILKLRGDPLGQAAVRGNELFRAVPGYGFFLSQAFGWYCRIMDMKLEDAADGDAYLSERFPLAIDRAKRYLIQRMAKRDNHGHHTL